MTRQKHLHPTLRERSWKQKIRRVSRQQVQVVPNKKKRLRRASSPVMMRISKSQLRSRIHQLTHRQRSISSRRRAKISLCSRVTKPRRSLNKSIVLGMKTWSNLLIRLSPRQSQRDIVTGARTKKTSKRLPRFPVSPMIMFIIYLATDYSKDKFAALDLENLNLFGVPLEQEESKGEEGGSAETRKVLQDLVSLMSNMDQNLVSNFHIRKSFVYYDVSHFSLSVIAL